MDGRSAQTLYCLKGAIRAVEQGRDRQGDRCCMYKVCVRPIINGLELVRGCPLEQPREGSDGTGSVRHLAEDRVETYVVVGDRGRAPVCEAVIAGK
jgi:hypothetical protein